MSALHRPVESLSVKSDKYKTHGTSLERLLDPKVRAQLEALRGGDKK